MRIMKEISFRCLIILVTLSLTFVAYDMSRPVLLSQGEILPQDVVECIVQPLQSLLDDKSEEISLIPSQGYNFLSNIILPIIIYIISIGGFIYILLEDLKLIKAFAARNKAAKLLFTLWLITLVILMLIPVLLGLQLLAKGLVIAVIATAIFLILIGILYAMYCKIK